jgi:stage II sporulation protein D
VDDRATTRAGMMTREVAAGATIRVGGKPAARRLKSFVALLVVVGCTSIAGGGAREEPRPPAPAPADTVDTTRHAPVVVPADSDVLGPENRVEAPPRPVPGGGGGPLVRVALVLDGRQPLLGATGDWRLYDGGGRSVLARARAGERWRVERRGTRLRAVRADGTASPWRAGPIVASPASRGALVRLGERRYRGELVVSATDSGMLVVNQLALEDYLRGVVPLEIGGTRPPSDRAAVEAQAVAARTYTIARLTSSRRGWDLQATVADQVYGGADAERPASDAAVLATRGLVVRYGGRVVGNAPYHSTCGGSTAATSESWWRSRDEPWLQRTSDRIPGTDRHYCDGSPRFQWTESWTGARLTALVNRYLGTYTAVPAGGPGEVRAVSVDGRTPSGRVASLTVTTDRGSYVVRGDDVRRLLRTAGGEILNSTYFSVDGMVVGRDGRLAQLTLRGTGYGHGIGMCQWGAIGRARAGQDFRTILRAYYPGTTVGRAG